METYIIKFPDKSFYVGATKHTGKVRLGNHLSKYKSGKYKLRSIYNKMEEFNGECTVKTLSEHSSMKETYQAEKDWISFFSGLKILNNSKGGDTCKGKKVEQSSINKLRKYLMRNSPTIKVYCNKTGKLFYEGKSSRDAAIAANCTQVNICMNVQKIKNGTYRNTHSRKIRVEITGGDLSQ